MTRPLALLLLIGSIAISGLAQDFRFEHITTADGLSHAWINALAQDQEGFIWIGTQQGLQRYDGYSFDTFWHDPNDAASLNHNRIEVLFVDHTGTLWIGTAAGLNRYDRGYNRFVRYQHDPDDPHSLTPGQVSVFLQDRVNNLWIGTHQGGLFRYEPEQDNFTRFLDDPEDPDNVLNTQVRALVEDQEGYLWIGLSDPFDLLSAGDGLIRYDPETDSSKRFIHDPDNPTSLLHNKVSALFEDRQGVLWIGTCGNGLHQYDPESEAFIRLQPDETNPNQLHAPQARLSTWGECLHGRVIHEDRLGGFWVGTFNAGLHHFDPVTKTLTRLVHDPSDPASLISNQVWAILEDQHGTLWVSTFGGLNKLDPYANKFRTYRHERGNPGSLGEGTVQAIYEDPSDPGIFWIGTERGGLNRLDRKTGRITQYRHNPNDTNSLGNDNVGAVYMDHGDVLWVGTVQGLDRLDLRTGRFEHFQHDPNNPNSLSGGAIRSIYEDHQGNLWIGTFGGGFNRYDREQQIFAQYSFPTPAKEVTYELSVFAIYEDRAGTLWVATWQNEVYRFDREANAFMPALQGTGANWLHEDTAGRFWLATQNHGLILFDRDSGDSRAYTTQDGLPTNSLVSILEDEAGHLWIGTHGGGLTKFNPETETFITYDVFDGLSSNTFTQTSAYKGSGSVLLFGGAEGLTAFYPEQVEENPHPPKVVLTGLKIFNESAQLGTPLSQAIREEEEITLTHSQSDLTFDYVGLHYSRPEQNQYQYKLEGYDPDWVQAGTQRSARYTNLDPDNYTFRVKAANSDGLWNEEGVSVRVTVTPPWWRATWAYMLYALLFIGGGFAVDRIQRKRLIRKERERALQRELEQKREIEKAHTELQQAHSHLQTTQKQLIQSEKMASLGSLTAGIAHEIKNPLNFINNFAEVNEELTDELRDDLAQHPKVLASIEDLLADLKQNAGVIAKHGKRADGIVQSMMQHAKGSDGHREATDVNAFVEEYFNLAYHGMRAKQADFNVTMEEDYDEAVGTVELVPQDIGRVLINLLNNAFYAVHERKQSINGEYEPKVAVATKQIGDSVEIRVSDNGPGISGEVRDKIFEPFYTTKPTGSGTGLGLSLSYDIVTAGHGGTMHVESEEGKGATFVVTLPSADG